MTSQLKHVRGAILLLLALAATVQLEARTWRLNPIEHAKADFTSINDAMADERVQPGDELLLDPGYYNSGEQKVTKENITITGPGYFINENFHWPEAREAFIVHNIIIDKRNCKIQGLRVNSTIHLNATVTISRCHVGYIEVSAPDCCIEQSYVKNVLYIKASRTTVRNNIILNQISTYYSSYTSCLVEYNTILPSNNNYPISGTLLDSEIRNNIFIYKYTNPDLDINEFTANFLNVCYRSSFYNNVFSATEVNQIHQNNHYVGATVENTFVDELIADRYYLRDGSAAKGGAQGGGDCGAFGGENPYVLSGIPLHTPRITEAIVPGRPTDGKVSVRIKMTVQDE